MNEKTYKDDYKNLEKALFDGKITPMEFVNKYNKLVDEYQKKHYEPIEKEFV